MSGSMLIIKRYNNDIIMNIVHENVNNSIRAGKKVGEGGTLDKGGIE